MPFRIDDSADRVVVRDTPSGQWVFGSPFVTSGLVVLSITFASDAWVGFSLWERLAVLAIGVGHFTIGAWYVWRYAETIVTFDRTTGKARAILRHPYSWRPQIADFTLDEARAIEIRQSVDSDGDAMYQLRLWLSGSRVIELQSQPSHGRETAEARAATLRNVLALPNSASTDTFSADSSAPA
ncbi:MAG TPA: hypothetical protein VJ865_06820 [Gemmatimonadaceae bacterium]|nr:hypothetical protein [Gemmatimonadaceae bacterium]